MLEIMSVPAEVLDLRKCCKALECDSSVERRKSFDKLQSLLKITEVSL